MSFQSSRVHATKCFFSLGQHGLEQRVDGTTNRLQQLWQERPRMFLINVADGGLLVGTYGADRQPQTADDYFRYAPLNG